ncbi:MAG: SRPBCC domain-containing protein [Chloroflexi bacterium]|nr:SRPBCC domain-containing protein [Chloroflexota bacterium]MBF6606839.1 SRPBCC domain-containing protein [Chloroflexota bacterium]
MPEATVLAPIRKAVTVRSDLDHTFGVFVREIGRWWPTRPFSLGQEQVVQVTFEPRLGGRVFETWADGRTVDWGHVLAWEPPARFAISWEILPRATEVEVHFRPLGPALTRVELEHRGWERLTAEQIAAATRQAGGYEAGWASILSDFVAATEAEVVSK